MKRRILTLFLAACVTGGFSGCGEVENSETTQTSETIETTLTVETMEEMVSETVPETEEIEEELEKEPGQIVGDFAYDGVIFQVDENGYFAGVIIIQDVITADFLSSEQQATLAEAEYKGLDENRLIFEHRKSVDGNVNTLVAVDFEKETYEEFFTYQDACNDCLNVYDGKVYLDTYGYDEPEAFMEYMFSYTEDGYVKEDAPLADVVTKYHELLNASGADATFAKSMGEFGYLVVEKEDSFFCLDENGNETLLDFMPGSVIQTYDESYIIYFTYDGNAAEYYAYSLSLHQSYPIKETFEEVYVHNGQMFLLMDEREEYGVSQMHLYSYIPGIGMDEEVYSCQDVPGLSGVSGQSGLCFVNGNIYYLYEEKDGIKWYMSKYTDAGFSPECLDVTYEKSPFSDYGNVTYLSHTDLCENCGYEFGDVYVEKIELTLDHPAVGAINEAIASFCQEAYNTAVNGVYECGMEDEAIHEEGLGAYAYDLTLTGVSILFDKYVTVDFLGYEYTGGMHGTLELKQLVFDLSSGEKMELSSFYQGPEESLRELIANKTKEDSQTYSSDHTPYYSTEEDAIYEAAYEMSLDGSEIFMEEDGIVVNYEPYSMGPYASGFIKVFISYEELGISF